jgi:dTDP-4-dehydrorhamnose 3,5-epimerase-like enzyme
MKEPVQIDGIKGHWIDGVKVIRKRRITDERGMIMHMLKSTD